MRSLSRWAPVVALAFMSTPATGIGAPELPVCRVATTRPVVGLSFDDGPDAETTRAAISLLRRHRARATFFLVGERAARWPVIVEDLRAGGHEVANHTWAHVVPAGLGPRHSAEEIRRADRVLVDAARLFRPPHGRIDVDGLRAAEYAGLTTVVWSVAVERHSLARGPDAASRGLLDRIAPGDIVLAHEAVPGTLGALDLVLEGLEARGMRAVPVGELLRAGRPVRAVPVDGPLGAGNTRYVCPG
ncbi:MAG: polysaccharide deacetylase family protein [Actinomycetota bacterium]